MEEVYVCTLTVYGGGVCMHINYVDNMLELLVDSEHPGAWYIPQVDRAAHRSKSHNFLLLPKTVC